MVQTYQMKKTSKDPRVLLVVLLVLSLGGSFLYAREGDEGVLHKIQNAIVSLASPLQYAGTNLDHARADAANAITDATANEQTLSQLQQENAALRQQLAETEEYRQEAERLEALLGMSEKYSISGVVACVVGRSTEAYDQTVVIDAGTNDGVDVGQSVMGPNGVVGQIVKVTPTSATVRLLTDPQSGVAVLLQATREEGVCVGSLDGFLYLEDISSAANVQVGDVVVTSGLGGSYTRGLIVGRVVRIDQRQGESTRRIVVSPNEEAGPLQEVIVVSNFDSQGAAA